MGNTEDRYKIAGGTPLSGVVEVSSSKNAAVAIIPACVLADGPCIIDKIPDITDIDVELNILRNLGATVEILDDCTIKIDCSDISTTRCDVNLAHKLRASYYFMGAMLGRQGEIYTGYPGGCKLGNRCAGLEGINYHIQGFDALGAEIKYNDDVNGELEFGLKEGFSSLVGADIRLEFPSVGATINIMLAAVKAKGKTVIRNAAKEPHVISVRNFLAQMGADIKGAGTDVITINGVDKLRGANCEIIPDQIEAGTYMIMAAATGGDVLVKNIVKEHMDAVTETLMLMGVGVEEHPGAVRIFRNGPLKGVNVTTSTYPGFPTDTQAIMAVLLCLAEGEESHIIETVTENRFKYVHQLRKMGADINVDNKNEITILGVPELTGANVEATDLRAGAALVVAGLCAKGETLISEIGHIDRGYEYLVEKITKLGGKIERVKC